MTAACNVVQRKRSHNVDDHDVDTAMFVRLHKGALQVRLPVVERTWASKPRWVGIWRVGIVESDELLNFDRLQKLAARRFARVPELRILQGDVFISVWDSGAVHDHHREVEAQERRRRSEHAHVPH